MSTTPRSTNLSVQFCSNRRSRPSAIVRHFRLPQAKCSDTHTVHILSGDLILHKRTMEPIKTMIYGLRRYDLDRCAALVDMADPKNADVKVVGFMSHRAKIYLVSLCNPPFLFPLLTARVPKADVFDHMEYILTSLDMFAGISENLIDYTFNVSIST